MFNVRVVQLTILRMSVIGLLVSVAIYLQQTN